MSPTFGTLGVPAPLVAALTRRGITAPTPIQAATLPDALRGRDVLGRGRTGSGKTYAFLLPLVARLAESPAPTRRRPGRPRALVLAPTRELVTQIDAALAPLAAAYGLRSRTVFGGVGQNPQVAALRSGVDVVLACPGRLEDLLAQGHLRLDDVEVTVLDEADHMSDLGFLPAVRRILDLTPRGSQRMLFSATLDGAVDVLVRRYLTRPAVHQSDTDRSPVDTMEHHVLHVTSAGHLPVLVDLAAAPGRTVVFTRTKHRAKTIARRLNASGVPSVELHGNLSQGARTRMMAAFTSGQARTLVATDIAARGIHVDDIEVVVHADPPTEHKAYLHRSGRTARAGNRGIVVTLATDEQLSEVRELTRRAGVKATTTRVAPGHPLLHELAPGVRPYADAVSFAADLAASAPAATSSGVRRQSRQSRPDRTARTARPSGGSGQRARARQPEAGPTRTPSATRQGAAAFSASSRVSGRRSR